MKKSNIGTTILTFLLAIPVFLLTLGNLQAQSPSPATLEKLVVYPTLIAYNGKIATMDNNLTTHQAMAIRGDRIWKLGTNQEIRELAGPQTQSIDLKGRTVVPGLIDVHTHPHMWAWWHFYEEGDPQIQPAFAHGKNLEEVKMNLQRVVQERIRQQGKDKWVMGSVPMRYANEVQRYSIGGILWKGDQGRLTVADLDRIAPDTPVVAVTRSTVSIANTKAREMMKQVLGYDYPSSVRIPYDLVWGVILKGKTEEAARLLSLEMQDSANYGVTTAGGHGENNTEYFKAMVMMDRKGTLPQRQAWTHEVGFYGSKDPEQYYRLLGDLSGQGSDYLWNFGVGWEAWDVDLPGNCISAQPKSPEMQRQAAAAGECIPKNTRHYQAHLAAAIAGHRLADVHNVNGDRVLDRAFDLAEDAIRSGSRTLEDIRQQGWAFDHNRWIRPDQVPLIKKYGFWLNFQGAQLAAQLYNIQTIYSPQYLSSASPLKSLLDAGIPFAIGTDVAISKVSNEAEDFLNLFASFPYRDSIWPHIGVWVQQETEVALGDFVDGSRRTVKVTLAPEQRIDRVSALKGMTTWAAETLLRGDRLGSLEPGKLADFVVVDKDYFTIPEPEIMNIKTLMTVLGGKVAYKAANF